MSFSPSWQAVGSVEGIASPAVLIFPNRIESNLRQMLAMAGSPDRLCPHVKTHKLPEIVKLQRALGIEKFKCATIAEAEMVADCGAASVLLAYQPVGPNISRLLDLIQRFPQTHFAAIVDHPSVAIAVARAAQERRVVVPLLVDIDCGMHRTGIAAGPEAFNLYRLLSTLPGVTPAGLHVYDGHIHDRDLTSRQTQVAEAMTPVQGLRLELRGCGLDVPRVVAGGTPTFPIHARSPDVECSPGTCVLWDGWSAASLPDLSFEPAAVVLTRVVSKPAPNRLTLDLGHKAIAAEMPPPRVELPGLPDAVCVMHNEEHLVIESQHASAHQVGDTFYGIPWHICPTMALHASVTVVLGGRPTQSWRVTARDRFLTL